MDTDALHFAGYRVEAIKTAEPNALILWYTYLHDERLIQFAFTEDAAWRRAEFHSRVCDILTPNEEMAAWGALEKIRLARDKIND
jgi:hypothetical protein